MTAFEAVVSLDFITKQRTDPLIVAATRYWVGPLRVASVTSLAGPILKVNQGLKPPTFYFYQPWMGALVIHFRIETVVSSCIKYFLVLFAMTRLAITKDNMSPLLEPLI